MCQFTYSQKVHIPVPYKTKALHLAYIHELILPSTQLAGSIAPVQPEIIRNRLRWS